MKNITYQNIFGCIESGPSLEVHSLCICMLEEKKNLKINDICPVLEEYNKPKKIEKKGDSKNKEEINKRLQWEKQQNQKFVFRKQQNHRQTVSETVKKIIHK